MEQKWGSAWERSNIMFINKNKIGLHPYTCTYLSLLKILILTYSLKMQSLSVCVKGWVAVPFLYCLWPGCTHCLQANGCQEIIYKELSWACLFFSSEFTNQMSLSLTHTPWGVRRRPRVIYKWKHFYRELNGKKCHPSTRCLLPL